MKEEIIDRFEERLRRECQYIMFGFELYGLTFNSTFNVVDLSIGKNSIGISNINCDIIIDIDDSFDMYTRGETYVLYNERMKVYVDFID